MAPPPTHLPTVYLYRVFLIVVIASYRLPCSIIIEKYSELLEIAQHILYNGIVCTSAAPPPFLTFLLCSCRYVSIAIIILLIYYQFHVLKMHPCVVQVANTHYYIIISNIFFCLLRLKIFVI